MSDYGIDWFAERMEAKMKENDHKRGWDDIDLDYALERIREEVEEMAPLIENWDYDSEQARQLVREAADVANFAFMIALRAESWTR